MWWKTPKLSVTDKDKAWVEESFARFVEIFGVTYASGTRMLLPTPEYFPDPYHGTPQCARLLLDRVCGYMNFDPVGVKLEIFDDHRGNIGGDILPVYVVPMEKTAAGYYLAANAEVALPIVAIEKQQLTEPTQLVATLAHEVSHVILLGGNLIELNRYHELLTDLCTVFCGFGIFSANTSCIFQQYQRNDGYHGWRTGRQGYLSQQVYGYALACWAWLHHDDKAPWERYLTENVKHDFRASMRYLHRTSDTTLTPLFPK